MLLALSHALANITHVKSFPSYKAHLAALISVSSALSQTPAYTASPQIRGSCIGASALWGVPVYVPTFTGTQCTYPRRDGQAELTCMDGYIPQRFTHLSTVTHSTTNRARRQLTMLIETNVLTSALSHHCTRQSRSNFLLKTRVELI